MNIPYRFLMTVKIRVLSLYLIRKLEFEIMVISGWLD